MFVEHVRPNQVFDIWPDLAPLVERGLIRGGHGEYLPADVLSAVTQGLLELWVVRDGDKITGGCLAQLVWYPRFRSLLVIWAAGILPKPDAGETWFDEGLYEIEDFARANNCRAVEIIGRDGWSRQLGLNGYTRGAVVLRKELK